MKKYLAGLAAVSVAGGAAPTLDSVQAAPEQNTQKKLLQLSKLLHQTAHLIR